MKRRRTRGTILAPCASAGDCLRVALLLERLLSRPLGALLSDTRPLCDPASCPIGFIRIGHEFISMLRSIYFDRVRPRRAGIGQILRRPRSTCAQSKGEGCKQHAERGSSRTCSQIDQRCHSARNEYLAALKHGGVSNDRNTKAKRADCSRRHQDRQDAKQQEGNHVLDLV